MRISWRRGTSRVQPSEDAQPAAAGTSFNSILPEPAVAAPQALDAASCTGVGSTPSANQQREPGQKGDRDVNGRVKGKAQQILGITPPVYHIYGESVLGCLFAKRRVAAAHLSNEPHRDLYLLRHTGLWRPKTSKLVNVLHTGEMAPPAIGEYLAKKINIISGLQHHNVARLKEAARTNEHILLLMETVGPERLLPLPQEAGRRFPPGEAQRIFRQVASAIGYCHGRDVVHRDLTPKSIVIAPGSGTVTIVDFSSAAEASVPVEQVGTVTSMAPEVMAMENLWYRAKKADIWSMGVLLVGLLCGVDFFPGILGWSNSEKAGPGLAEEVRGFLLSEERLTQAVIEHGVPVGTDLGELLNGMLRSFIPRRWTTDMVATSAWLAHK